ncbi:alpha-E domain-containing protein [Chitinivorax sp. PXF-14]|uniref:alpha-E domain-containing protein n=1 Tax=Chitinivorax sp. PXF-14 TaxID=3230488 RepID=UPI0034658F10
MLSRTAECLYWMARNMERAENTARLLDVSLQMSLLHGGGSAELMVPLDVTGQTESYRERYGEPMAEAVLRALAIDADNPASIFNCIRYARENARVVRGKITSEMWEQLNATWLEMREWARRDLDAATASALLDWVKERSHLFRGVTYGTILRNDAFHFSRLGTFIERADNTARILNVKFKQIKDSEPVSENILDYYQWAALLRSVSAFEAYRDIYRDRITPQRVAELLILRPDVPRSLRAAFDEISQILPNIEGNTGHPAKRLAAELKARLTYGHIDDIFAEGLQRYLDHFIADTTQLGFAIHRSYLEAA